MAAQREYDWDDIKYSYQVDGNTVRQPLEREEEPVEIPEVIEIPQEERSERRARRKQLQRQAAVSPAYFAFMAAMACTVLVLAVAYLSLNASINSHMANIEELTEQLEDLEEMNARTKSSIEASIDMEEIYRIATEELGMVYPDDDQVITYDQTEREYVLQDEDIPTE